MMRFRNSPFKNSKIDGVKKQETPDLFDCWNKEPGYIR